MIAIQTALQSGSPDAIVKAAEDLLNNYADSDYKEYALTMEAKAYQNKNDLDNAQIFADRVLQINSKAYTMQLLIAEAITPNIKEHDLNYADEIAKCTKLFNDAIENAKVAVKPNPQVSDADWENARKFAVAEAYNGLAFATRLANAYLTAGKKPEALALCDKLLAKPTLDPRIKSVVVSLKNAASH